VLMDRTHLLPGAFNTPSAMIWLSGNNLGVAFMVSCFRANPERGGRSAIKVLERAVD